MLPQQRHADSGGHAQLLVYPVLYASLLIVTCFPTDLSIKSDITEDFVLCKIQNIATIVNRLITDGKWALLDICLLNRFAHIAQ